MPRIVILGTGTGVGKTYATSALARALSSVSNGTVVAVKPIETGVASTRTKRGDGPPPRTDAHALERASHGPVLRPHPLYAFSEPISAHLAARRAGVRISLPRICHWAASAIRDDIWQLIETAGGAFSPLSTRSTNMDLAKALEPCVRVLIAPDALGVLHDVFTTVRAMDAKGRIPDFLVLSESRTNDASTGTNAAELARLGLPRPIAVIRRGGGERSLIPLARALIRRERARRQ
jgi:dethiobiotin synthetase